MATLDYVEIPAAATRLRSNTPTDDIRPAPKILTSLPHPERANGGAPAPTASQLFSPTKSGFNFQQILLSNALQIPSNGPSTPRASKGTPKLLSTRDPLSIPITTVNFKRFVSKTGPVFWLQDRVEEVVMWRKGEKYTAVWMCVYAFLCVFPRLLLVLPLVIFASVMLATHPYLRQAPEKSDDPKVASVPPPPPAQSSEGSVDWLANVQAIQNLMGAVSDAHDAVYPAVPHLNHSTPYTTVLLSLCLALIPASIPLAYLIPLRLTLLILGLLPLFLTHPFTRSTLIPAAIALIWPRLKILRSRVTRLIDNDRLEDKHWASEMREVELWENERWAGTSSADSDISQADAGWNKSNLRSVERKAWTRGRDGWSGVTDDGSGDVSSNLTFSLSTGWLFVETEEWRPDLEGRWIGEVGTDDNGWVYTNDMWMNPQSTPLDEWKAGGMTRRRRWTRRIYYDPKSVVE